MAAGAAAGTAAGGVAGTAGEVPGAGVVNMLSNTLRKSVRVTEGEAT
jgi:hypothetical protein